MKYTTIFQWWQRWQHTDYEEGPNMAHIVFKRFLVVCTAIGLLGMVACKAKKEIPSFVVVNVLDKEFYDDCHIQGSINVPFMDLEEYAEQYWDKEKTAIVLYCSNYSCTASGYGAATLREKGFKHVWAYEGGSAEWKHLGFPVAGPCNEPFLEDYKPLATQEQPGHAKDIVITAEELHKKMAEFATK